MHATSKLTRMVLLIAALCVAAGPLSGALLAAVCAEACCCGTVVGPASDDCGCEIEAPPEPAPLEPQAPLGAEPAPTHAPALEFAGPVEVVLTVPSGPAGRGEGPTPRSPWRPPARLLHCSFTL